jgi:hypothetical protein
MREAVCRVADDPDDHFSFVLTYVYFLLGARAVVESRAVGFATTRQTASAYLRQG